jgi:hypothetical protein
MPKSCVPALRTARQPLDPKDVLNPGVLIDPAKT